MTSLEQKQSGMAQGGAARPIRRAFVQRHPSVLIFLACLAVFTLGVTLLSEATGTGLISCDARPSSPPAGPRAPAPG